MIPIRIPERRLIKLVYTDPDGLPAEQIVREPRSLRFRLLLARVLPGGLARIFGLTPFAGMMKRYRLRSYPA